jgi:TolB-like protein/class 3 adenylate cyclase
LNEIRKLAAILAADVVGFSRLAGADEDRTLARLRTLRSDLIDPTIAVHRGRVVKRTGDGLIVEFRSVVDAVRCAVEVQNAMIERNAGVPEDRRIVFRMGIHLGDVVEESDGDLMGDGVNIAARLEGVAKPGAICLSEDAYRQVGEKLRRQFVELGEKSLKNIARPIEVYEFRSGYERAEGAPSASAPNNQGSPRLSIVVLPFTNMAGDADQEFFVDGVTESLTTDLSRISGSFVIARNTAFTYKGKPVDVKQIGRDLNVRYVLEGSVQRAGVRMRVSVQLIDAESGNHLWAERFDKPLADFFDMQDEIVSRLANALSAQLIGIEARRAARSPNPDSIDFCFQGWAWFGRGFRPDYLAEARRLFEHALALDPANVDGLVGVASVDSVVSIAFFPEDRAARLAAAEEALIRALSLAPENAVAHMGLGIIQIFTNRTLQGVRGLERALELNQNLAYAHGQLGTAKILLGHAEDAEAHIQEALRLSPHDTFGYIWCSVAGSASLCLGKDEEAVTWLRRSIESNRNFPISHFYLAAALAHLGRLPEARSEAQAGLVLNPAFTLRRIRAEAMNVNPTAVSERERIIDGLRVAGVPEE